jgi:hypothetical protein
MDEEKEKRIDEYIEKVNSVDKQEDFEEYVAVRLGHHIAMADEVINVSNVEKVVDHGEGWEAHHWSFDITIGGTIELSLVSEWLSEMFYYAQDPESWMIKPETTFRITVTEEVPRGAE